MQPTSKRIDDAFARTQNALGPKSRTASTRDVVRRCARFLRNGDFCEAIGGLSALAFQLRKRDANRRSTSLAAVLHALGEAQISLRWQILIVESFRNEDFRSSAMNGNYLANAHASLSEAFLEGQKERLSSTALHRIMTDLAKTYMCSANFLAAMQLLAPQLESPLEKISDDSFERYADDRNLLPLEKRTRSPKTIVALNITDRWDSALLMAVCLRYLGKLSESASYWQRLSIVLPDGKSRVSSSSLSSTSSLFPGLASRSGGHVDSFAVCCGWSEGEALFQLGRTYDIMRGSSEASGHARYAFEQARRALQSKDERSGGGGGGRRPRVTRFEWARSANAWLDRCRLYMASQIPHLASDAVSQIIRLDGKAVVVGDRWEMLGRLFVCGGHSAQARIVAIRSYRPLLASLVVDPGAWNRSAALVQRVWRGHRVRKMRPRKRQRATVVTAATHASEYDKDASPEDGDNDDDDDDLAKIAGLDTSVSTARKRWTWSQRLVRTTSRVVRGLRDAVREARASIAGPSVDDMIRDFEEEEAFDKTLLREIRTRASKVS